MYSRALLTIEKLLTASNTIEILKATGIEREAIRIISNLYWQQTAEVKLEGTMSEVTSIKRGVQQGCVLSPLLFNIYSETIFKEDPLRGDYWGN